MNVGNLFKVITMRGNSRIDSYKIARGGILLKVSRTPTVGPKSALVTCWARVTQMVRQNLTMRGRWPHDILDGVCRQTAAKSGRTRRMRRSRSSVRIGDFAHTQKDHVCVGPHNGECLRVCEHTAMHPGVSPHVCAYSDLCFVARVCKNRIKCTKIHCHSN